MSEIKQQDSILNAENINWAEIRLLGRFPERKGYHSAIIHNKR